MPLLSCIELCPTMCINIFVPVTCSVCEGQAGVFLRDTCLKGSWICYHPDLHVWWDSKNSKRLGVSGSHLPAENGHSLVLGKVKKNARDVGQQEMQLPLCHHTFSYSQAGKQEKGQEADWKLLAAGNKVSPRICIPVFLERSS